MDKVWDAQNGGWGKSKLTDGPTLLYHLDRAKQGDAKAAERVRLTLGKMRVLQDGDSGAFSQVTTKPDWSGVTREYPMFAQEAALAAYARAWVLWGDAADLDVAKRIMHFLTGPMRSPEGGFYTSLGMAEGQPGIDRRRYSRENGQAIAGLLAVYDATGDAQALAAAIGSAKWVIANRGLGNGGGFRHDERDAAGPFLADNIEMTKAFLALHRSTGDRQWLVQARSTADYVARTFIEQRTGAFVASATPDAKVVTTPIKQREDNVTATRTFNLLSFYTGDARYREIAEAGMGYLVSPLLDAYGFLPDVLQAEEELQNEPVHITIVGAKDDPRASLLNAAALKYPLSYKRVEWWDKREGKLANADVDYPDYPGGAAAFACTKRFCSLPVTEPGDIAGQVDRLQRKLP